MTCINGYADHDFDQTPSMAYSACVRCDTPSPRTLQLWADQIALAGVDVNEFKAQLAALEAKVDRIIEGLRV